MNFLPIKDPNGVILGYYRQNSMVLLYPGGETRSIRNYKNGKLHGNTFDSAGRTEYDEEGKVFLYALFDNGNLVADMPAIHILLPDNDWLQLICRDGQVHNSTGPAAILTDLDGIVKEEYYFLYGWHLDKDTFEEAIRHIGKIRCLINRILPMPIAEEIQEYFDYPKLARHYKSIFDGGWRQYVWLYAATDDYVRNIVEDTEIDQSVLVNRLLPE